MIKTENGQDDILRLTIQMQLSFWIGYLTALGNPRLMGTAIRVALIVGSILLAINHGSALVNGKMTRDRWLSALLTYCVPYAVSIHGQYSAQQQRTASAPDRR